MRPRFYNFNCRESNALDLRQAEAVLKYQPDIIFLEYPNNDKELKPRTRAVKSFSKKTLKASPWAKSDLIMWKNVEHLWRKRLKTKVYAVDGPSELNEQYLLAWHNTYPCATKNWFWWVHIYLRERFMAKHITEALNDYEDGKNPVVLIFLQSFHWQHVKFLLTKPSREKMWKYYFGKFEKEISAREIPKILKRENKTFYKYWQKFPL
jgi:hypothetical protein